MSTPGVYVTTNIRTGPPTSTAPAGAALFVVGEATREGDEGDRRDEEREPPRHEQGAAVSCPVDPYVLHEQHQPEHATGDPDDEVAHQEGVHARWEPATGGDVRRGRVDGRGGGVSGRASE